MRNPFDSICYRIALFYETYEGRGRINGYLTFSTLQLINLESISFFLLTYFRITVLEVKVLFYGLPILVLIINAIIYLPMERYGKLATEWEKMESRKL